VWALAISADESTIVSGAADSVVTFWTDETDELELEKEQARATAALREQDIQNYLALHDYRRAIELALSLAQPGRLFSLFKSLPPAPVKGTEESLTGSKEVDEVIRRLSFIDLATLLRFIRDWNVKASSAEVAQRVLKAIITLRRADDITRALDGADPSKAKTPGGGVKEMVEALIPYTERHLARMDRLVQESYVVDYILGEMDMVSM
jgi:U3 small nucleolar RNA-associated protein 13